MTSQQTVLTSPDDQSIPFEIHAQDAKLLGKTQDISATAAPDPPLGVLSNFTGVFHGHGLNTIFRPNNGPKGTTFPNPVSPPPPTTPSENVLELNLTSERLTFLSPLGNVPNRGLFAQGDIFLNGVPYQQQINDVSNPATGLGDSKPTPKNGIHFEPGLWMHVPATDNDPVLAESLVRMASIPHGTTINAQGPAPTSTISGPPTIPSTSITPFPIGGGNLIRFISQDINNKNTPRLPQDLTKFKEKGTITQEILDDPNTVLRKENAGKDIIKTTKFTVSTLPTSPELGGGTANIAFLQGAPASQPAPNADAAQMSATFWIEEVQYKLEIPVHKHSDPPLKITAPRPHPGALVPTFSIKPPVDITTPKTITVTSTQIQYSQLVFLNFAGLTWPHVSVATLVPAHSLPVPESAFK